MNTNDEDVTFEMSWSPPSAAPKSELLAPVDISRDGVNLRTTLTFKCTPPERSDPTNVVARLGEAFVIMHEGKHYLARSPVSLDGAVEVDIG